MFDWQTILVFLLIAAAAYFVTRRVWRKLRQFFVSNKSDCATGCGKCK